MEAFELKVKNRTSCGKGAARELRRQGNVPAILYGHNTEPTMLAVAVRDLDKILEKSSEHVILKLLMDGDVNSGKLVMLKELQSDPVSQRHLHADFYQVSMNKPLKVKVAVVMTGKAKGTELGGLVNLSYNELEILCLPLDIPNTIEIDVSGLDIGDSLQVKDIVVSEKIKVLTDSEFTLVNVLSPVVATEEKSQAQEEVEPAEGKTSAKSAK
ncbi:MAG: 50S ribosomal protein L25 [Pseudomonadota bacterium]